MGEHSPGRRAPPERPEGLIGWVEGKSEGPLLLCVGGLHGNEPAGVRGLEEVFRQVRTRRRLLAGDFVAVVGNVRAVAAGRRFLSYDLNRVWTRRRIDRARSRMRSAKRTEVLAEDREVLRILALIDLVAARSRGPVHLLDLHSTSAGGGPFSTAASGPGQGSFATAIPVPLVKRLGAHLEGTLAHHLDRLGYTTAVFESGQHEEPEAEARAAGAVWLAIRAAGLLADRDVPEARRAHEALELECRRLPRVLEVTYRHAIQEADRYVTRPGFRNFQQVRAGEIVGDDRHGEVSAPKGGRILMPLYQELGEEGFFVVRDVAALGTGGRASRGEDGSAPPSRTAANDGRPPSADAGLGLRVRSACEPNPPGRCAVASR